MSAINRLSCMRLVACVAVLVGIWASECDAQGPSQFWKPLTGPPAAGAYFTILPDSQIATQVGGAAYVYIPGTNSWRPASTLERKALVQPGRTPHPAVPLILGRYASYQDTLYFSSDFGAHWTVVGTFGAPGKTRIRGLVETPSGNTVLLNDANALFVTHDIFKTIDTEYLPDPARNGLSNDGDTLYITTNHGKLLRSIDFGKHWVLLFNHGDTTGNYHLVLDRKNALWLLTGCLLSTVFPYSDTDVFLGYSLDRGATWVPMYSPVDNRFPGLSHIDKDDRIFVRFDSTYRTGDLGKTWTTIKGLGLVGINYIAPDGTIYGNGLRSFDHGDTWDTLRYAGIACVPFDMLAMGDASALSTSDSIFRTVNNGIDWKSFYYLANPGPYSEGPLSRRPDSGYLMINTTERLIGSNGFIYLCSAAYNPTAGIGCITSGFHVWVCQSQRLIAESLDTGCSYSTWDTISLTPVLRVLETSNDTVLAVSSSSLMKGYDAFSPFVDVSPQQSIHPPTGAIAKDSTGAIYVATSDGKLFVTKDGANSWSSFPSPATDSIDPVQHLTAGPAGYLFAIDSNRKTGETFTFEYEPSKSSWRDITYGLKRQNFVDTAKVTNIWYANNYVYAGTWNMGLFRSTNSLISSGIVEEEHGTPLRVFPNPANQTLSVSYPTTLDGYFTLCDIMGHEWRRERADRSTLRVAFEICDLPSGIYEICSTGVATRLAAKVMVSH